MYWRYSCAICINLLAWHCLQIKHNLILIFRITWLIIQRSLVRAPMWSLAVVCCVLRQLGTLCTLSQSTQLEFGTSLHWGLTCDGLVFHPGGVKDSYCLALGKLEIGTGLMCLHGFWEIFNFNFKCKNRQFHWLYI